MPSIREITQENEKRILSEYAVLSCNTKGREREEPECSVRTAFQRDRDRILHCASFRRLKHKTQVFIAPEGDHYRTRLTHTLEVSQIARTIARALRLNEDLTEAIALGHDLGHTPFGHAGERALSRCIGGAFHHYEQSVRVVKLLEKNGQGLNLTYEVCDGILCHTNGQAKTLEGRVVKFADKIAYMNHDIDDAQKAGVLSETDIPSHLREGLGGSKSARINTMVNALIAGSGEDITMPPQYLQLFDELHRYLFKSVYTNPVAKGEEHKAEDLIATLFSYFSAHPELLPAEYQTILQKEGVTRAVLDYIAGMTDRYAVFTYNKLFIPKSWSIY